MLPLLDIDSLEGTTAAAVSHFKARPEQLTGLAVSRALAAYWEGARTSSRLSRASEGSTASSVGTTAMTAGPYVVMPGLEALSAIKRLRDMASWGDGWDAEGAPAPDPAALDSAMVLVGFLEPMQLRIRATLTARGEPMILIGRDSAEGEIVFHSRDDVSFAWLDEGIDIHGEASFTGLHLPPALQVALQPLRAAA